MVNVNRTIDRTLKRKNISLLQLFACIKLNFIFKMYQLYKTLQAQVKKKRLFCASTFTIVHPETLRCHTSGIFRATTRKNSSEISQVNFVKVPPPLTPLVEFPLKRMAMKHAAHNV